MIAQGRQDTRAPSQNLACGVLEMQPADGSAGGGADSEEDEEPFSMQLPSNQSAAMRAAQRAGRSLVSEVPGPSAAGARAGRARPRASPAAGDAPGASADSGGGQKEAAPSRKRARRR